MLRTMILAAAVAVTGLAYSAPAMAQADEFVIRVPEGPNPDPSEFVVRFPDEPPAVQNPNEPDLGGRAQAEAIGPGMRSPLTDQQRLEIGARCMLVLDNPGAYSPDVVAFCEAGL